MTNVATAGAPVAVVLEATPVAAVVKTAFDLRTATLAVHTFSGFKTRPAARDFMFSLFQIGSNYGARSFKCKEKDDMYAVRFSMKIPRGKSSVSVPWVDHVIEKFDLQKSCWSIKTKKTIDW